MDESIPLWAADIVARLQRIEDALHIKQMVRASNSTMTSKEVAERLRCGSLGALYHTAAEIGLKPYAHNKWRRGDVENAVARASFRAQKQGRPAL